MSLTENGFIVPFSLTGISNFNGSVNGGGVVSNITILGQTAYLTASLVDSNGNIDLDLHIPTATASITGLLSSSDFNIFNNKENVLSFSYPLSRTGNTVSVSTPNLLISNNTWTGTNTFNGLLTMNNGYTMNTGSAVFNSGQMFFNLLPNTVGDRILSHQLSSGQVRSITPTQFYAAYPPPSSSIAGISLQSTNTVVGIGSGGSLANASNTIVGANSSPVLSTGIRNISLGIGSNPNLTTGSDNIGIGDRANSNIDINGLNISIGYAAGYALGSRSACLSIGYITNYNHSFSNCLHISAGTGAVGYSCNGSNQWMGPSPWQNNTGGYYVSTGFGPSNNLIGYFYSSYLSDVRTKSNIVDANTSYYLDLVSQMRVRNFKYNDGKNNMNVGLITQEMETNDNLRFLIDENEGYTFDINGFFKFDNFKMMIPKSLKEVNEDKISSDAVMQHEEKEENCLKIYIDTVKHVLVKGDYIRYARDRDTTDIDFVEMESEIIECGNDYIVIENSDHIGIKDIGHNDSDLTTIFIEGKWVKDIKLIKKDAMAFVLIPAIQQLTKENEDLKARFAKLEAVLEKVLLRFPS